MFEDAEQDEDEPDNVEEVFDESDADLLNASMRSTGTLVSSYIYRQYHLITPLSTFRLIPVPLGFA